MLIQADIADKCLKPIQTASRAEILPTLTALVKLLNGRSGEIRTHTGQSLKLLPLPLGYRPIYIKRATLIQFSDKTRRIVYSFAVNCFLIAVCVFQMVDRRGNAPRLSACKAEVLLLSLPAHKKISFTHQCCLQASILTTSL